MNVEYKVGDILLVDMGYMKELEVQEVAVKAKCIQLDGSWYETENIAPKIKQVLGRAIYKHGFFGKKRVVEYI